MTTSTQLVLLLSCILEIKDILASYLMEHCNNVSQRVVAKSLVEYFIAKHAVKDGTVVAFELLCTGHI